MFYSLILLLLKKPGQMTSLVVLIPSLVVVYLAMRNYCSTIIATQEFSRMKGAVSMAIAFILFLIVIAGGTAIIAILFEIRYALIIM